MLMLTREEAKAYMDLEGAMPNAVCITDSREFTKPAAESILLESAKYHFIVRHKKYPGIDVTIRCINSLSEYTSINVDRLCNIFGENHEPCTTMVDSWLITSKHNDATNE